MLKSVWVAVVLFASGYAAAAENHYSTPVGTVIVDVDSNWSEMSSLPDGLEGIGFQVDNGKTMQFVLGTFKDLPAGGIDRGTLRALTNDLRRSHAQEKFAVSEELMTVSGSNFTGYYCLATNPASMPAPGRFKYQYTGFVSVGSNPMMFVIGWNSGGKTAADRALATLNRMRIKDR